MLPDIYSSFLLSRYISFYNQVRDLVSGGNSNNSNVRATIVKSATNAKNDRFSESPHTLN
jgi:hypothetical protein